MGSDTFDFIINRINSNEEAKSKSKVSDPIDFSIIADSGNIAAYNSTRWPLKMAA